MVDYFARRVSCVNLTSKAEVQRVTWQETGGMVV